MEKEGAMLRGISRPGLLVVVLTAVMAAAALTGCAEETPATEVLDDRPEVARADLGGVEVEVHREPG